MSGVCVSWREQVRREEEGLIDYRWGGATYIYDAKTRRLSLEPTAFSSYGEDFVA